MLIMSGFLIAACSKVDAEDTNKETIKKVLEHQFTGPDEQFVELFNKDDFTEFREVLHRGIRTLFYRICV